MLSSYLKGERREFLGKVGNCFGKKGGELHFFIDKAERGSKKVLFFWVCFVSVATKSWEGDPVSV